MQTMIEVNLRRLHGQNEQTGVLQSIQKGAGPLAKNRDPTLLATLNAIWPTSVSILSLIASLEN